MSSATASKALVTDANKKISTEDLAVTAQTAADNKWVSSIGQSSTGKISVSYASLVTSGTWSGTATKATTTADTSNTMYAVGVKSGATSTLLHTTAVTFKNGAVSASTYNGLTLTAAATGFTIAGGTTSKTLTVSGTYTLADACAKGVKDATANGALSSSGTNLTTERAVYYGLVTVNNASQSRANGIYAPTSAGTANQILVSAGGTSAPTWKATASGAAYATSSNGALTFGTLPIAQGGTNKTSWTQWGIVYASASDTLAQVTAGASDNNGYVLQSKGAAKPDWIQATDSNVVSTIMKRDSNGDFSAREMNATTISLGSSNTMGKIYLYSGHGEIGLLKGGYATDPTNTQSATLVGTVTADYFKGSFIGNVYGNATSAQWLMNRGNTTVTIADSGWAAQTTPPDCTNRQVVWKQAWYQSGLTYTPPSGTHGTSNTPETLTDCANMILYTSSSNTSNDLVVNLQIDGRFFSSRGYSTTGDIYTSTTVSAGSNISAGGTITSSSKIYGLTGGEFGKWAANTAQSAQFCVKCLGGAGQIYFYVDAATNGNRGIYTYNTSGAGAWCYYINSANTTANFYGAINSLSTRDKKHNITNIPNMGSIIDRLNPISFVYNGDEYNTKHYGLIYEDTLPVCPTICSDQLNMKTINYVELVPVLLKEIQDLRKRLASLENNLS